jgi:DNA-binding CsgD family transcriptional regulator
VRGLLYRIAHNLAVSEYRMERARERADSVGGDSHADAPTPLAAVEDAELREMLDRAIQALPPRRREVFVLRCIHDMPYRDIAEVLGISQQTVANQLSRALTTLRLILRPSELLQVEPEQSGTARQDEQARLRLAVLRYREYEAARQRRGANGSGNGHLEPRLTRRGDGLYGQQRRREGDARQQTSEHRGPSGYRCTGCARRAVRCRSSSRHAARQRFVPCPR